MCVRRGQGYFSFVMKSFVCIVCNGLVLLRQAVRDSGEFLAWDQGDGERWLHSLPWLSDPPHLVGPSNQLSHDPKLVLEWCCMHMAVVVRYILSRVVRWGCCQSYCTIPLTSAPLIIAFQIFHFRCRDILLFSSPYFRDFSPKMGLRVMMSATVSA